MPRVWLDFYDIRPNLSKDAASVSCQLTECGWHRPILADLAELRSNPGSSGQLGPICGRYGDSFGRARLRLVAGGPNFARVRHRPARIRPDIDIGARVRHYIDTTCTLVREDFCADSIRFRHRLETNPTLIQDDSDSLRHSSTWRQHSTLDVTTLGLLVLPCHVLSSSLGHRHLLGEYRLVVPIVGCCWHLSGTSARVCLELRARHPKRAALGPTRAGAASLCVGA